jgi:pyruvate ferredoxin oxidoreductase beta subunit
VHIAKLAVETCFWPLYEVTEHGSKWTVTYKPAQKLPLVQWLQLQGRFKHLEVPENRHILEKLQERVDKDWELLLLREKQVCL